VCLLHLLRGLLNLLSFSLRLGDGLAAVEHRYHVVPYYGEVPEVLDLPGPGTEVLHDFCAALVVPIPITTRILLIFSTTLASVLAGRGGKRGSPEEVRLSSIITIWSPVVMLDTCGAS
jgi:hypothetical protein